MTKPLSPVTPAGQIVMVFDVQLRRPACALLQATWGGARGRELNAFLSGTWLTSPTPAMKPVAGTPEEWAELARLTNASLAAGTLAPAPGESAAELARWASHHRERGRLPLAR